MNNEQFPVSAEYESMPEEKLVDHCKEGKLCAFNALISRYESRVLSQTVRYMQDYQTAMDEAQEVFLKVFRKIQTFNGNSSFATWLYRITTNHCLNVISRRKRHQYHQHVSLEASQESAGDLYAQDTKSVRPDDKMETEQMESYMREAISRLPADQQKVIVLRHFEDMGYEEIAELMNVPVTTVCSCLHRARRQLKNIINRKGGLRK